MLVFSIGLFLVCMFCHGELAHRRPGPRHLTFFYLVVSLGGVLGGAVYDALGIRIDEVPITPEKVLAALEGRYKTPQMPVVTWPETVVVPPLEPAAVPEEVRR